MNDDRPVLVDEIAEILGVGVRYAWNLVVDGQIPSRFSALEYRIMLSDVLEFKKQSKARSMKAMQELTELSQEHGMYDEETA